MFPNEIPILLCYEIDSKHLIIFMKIQIYLRILKFCKPKVLDFCQMFVIAKQKSRTLGSKPKARPRSEKPTENLKARLAYGFASLWLSPQVVLEYNVRPLYSTSRRNRKIGRILKKKKTACINSNFPVMANLEPDPHWGKTLYQDSWYKILPKKRSDVPEVSLPPWGWHNCSFRPTLEYLHLFSLALGKRRIHRLPVEFLTVY